jgi:alpha-N-arabinofuranosidase
VFFAGGEAAAGKPSPWAGFGLWVYDQREFSLFTGGNAYLAGARPYFRESDALKSPEPGSRAAVVTEGSACFLRLTQVPDLRNASTQRVTTEVLGKSRVTGLAYENADGTPLIIDYDYFGKRRSAGKPSPGPFENPGAGDLKLKVW